MCARQHKWGGLLPNREDTDGVRRPPLEGVGAPHQCSRANEKRSGLGGVVTGLQYQYLRVLKASALPMAHAGQSSHRRSPDH